MVDNKTFRKLLYIVAYVMAAILFTIGIFSRSDEIIGLSWIHLLVGAFFNFRYFIYDITHNDNK